jgi:hypothetical protein
VSRWLDIYLLNVTTPLAIAAVLAVIALRRKPRLRRWRYEAIASGIWLIGVDFIGQSEPRSLVLFWFLVPIMSSLISRPLANRLYAQNLTPRDKIKLAQRIYKMTHRLFSSEGSIVLFAFLTLFALNKNAVGLLFSLSVLTLICYLRYVVGEFLSYHPILYLRAFERSAIFKTFHSVLVPAVATRHVIVGLSRSAEHRTLLKRSLGFTTASLYVTSETDWRDWVTRELGRAFVVIFDYSIESNSLVWELEQARNICGVEQLLILVGKDQGSLLDSSLRRIELGSSRRETRSVRQEIANWLQSL